MVAALTDLPHQKRIINYRVAVWGGRRERKEQDRECHFSRGGGSPVSSGGSVSATSVVGGPSATSSSSQHHVSGSSH